MVVINNRHSINQSITECLFYYQRELRKQISHTTYYDQMFMFMNYYE